MNTVMGFPGRLELCGNRELVTRLPRGPVLPLGPGPRFRAKTKTALER